MHQYLRCLKWKQCPVCGRVGFLIGHGFLKGYSATGQERVIRGRRFYCSNRYRKGGCGRTFSVLLSDMIRGYMVTATILWQFVQAVEKGLGINRAWRSAAKEFSVDSGYRILRCLKMAQSRLRTMLCRIRPPPYCASKDPLLQLTAHLQTTFPLSSCPFISFQHHFQEPLLG
jgi:hypothetical protein